MLDYIGEVLDYIGDPKFWIGYLLGGGLCYLLFVVFR